MGLKYSVMNRFIPEGAEKDCTVWRDEKHLCQKDTDYRTIKPKFYKIKLQHDTKYNWGDQIREV